jgi:cytochrome c
MRMYGFLALVALVGTSLAPAMAVEADADPAVALAERRGCFTCHDPREPRIGPSFQAIATAHRGDPRAEARLMDKIETGGRGHWGDEYNMSPQFQLRPGEAQTLVRWVLAQ